MRKLVSLWNSHDAKQIRNINDFEKHNRFLGYISYSKLTDIPSYKVVLIKQANSS